MITVDWTLFAGMLAGTASLSALLGLLLGLLAVNPRLKKRHGYKASIPKGAYRLLCEDCQHARFDMPDHTSFPCRQCDKLAGSGFDRKIRR